MEGKLIEKLRTAVKYVGKMHIPIYASHASFFITLSVFPMLLLLMSILRYTGISVDTLTESLTGVIPQALIPFVKKQILGAYQSTSGTVISVSALVALWSASRGIYGLRKGLNAVYRVQEDRSWFYTRSISMVYTFAFLLVLLLTLALQVFGTAFLRIVPAGGVFLDRVVNLRFFLLLLLQTAVFTAMYTVLPNRRNRLTDSFPGGVFSSVGWLLLSDLYSRYVEIFSGYANIYGSVYALALSMLWLYCCVSLLLYGGALNVYLTKDNGKLTMDN